MRMKIASEVEGSSDFLNSRDIYLLCTPKARKITLYKIFNF
jgi:hypothetical protein